MLNHFSPFVPWGNANVPAYLTNKMIGELIDPYVISIIISVFFLHKYFRVSLIYTDLFDSFRSHIVSEHTLDHVYPYELVKNDVQ